MTDITSSKTKGFTLIELLIVIFLSSLMLIGLFGLYTWHSKIYSYQQALIGVTEQSRYVGDVLQTYGTQSFEVLDSFTIDSVNYVSTTTAVVLALPVLDNNGSASPGIKDVAVLYAENEKIYFKLTPDNLSGRSPITRLLSDSAQSFNLTYDSADVDQIKTVSVEARFSITSQSGTVVVSDLKQSVNLRNNQ